MNRKHLKKSFRWKLFRPVPIKAESTEEKNSAGAAAPNQPEKQTSKKSARPSPKPAARSARPTKISYVPITDEELDEKIIPVPRKKHKGLKVTGIVAAILAVTAGCAYGAVSYYYTDRFFEGTYINGINCSNKTAYETEQLIASNVRIIPLRLPRGTRSRRPSAETRSITAMCLTEKFWIFEAAEAI